MGAGGRLHCRNLCGKQTRHAQWPEASNYEQLASRMKILCCGLSRHGVWSHMGVAKGKRINWHASMVTLTSSRKRGECYVGLA